MDIFIAAFYVLSALCIYLFYSTKTALQHSNDISFKSLQGTYLLVYLLSIGPYVYALYQSYGISTHGIDILFVAGFGSSMLFGTFVGSLADKYGRRFNCILYGILYGVSCLTKHFSNFYILMIGRLFGGIATSILYSAFESWLIYEANDRSIDSQSLGTLFSRAYLGNSIVAIISGLIAQVAANYFGYVAPFDIAFVLLLGMIVVIIYTWNENYGNPKSDVKDTFATAFYSIKNDYRIASLGLVQALFEGCMYTFVLEWTPSLSLVRRRYALSTKKALLVGGTQSSQSDTAGAHVKNNNNYLNGETNLMGAASLFKNFGNNLNEYLKSSSEEDNYVLESDQDIPHGYIFAGFMVAIMIGSLLFKVFSAKTVPESFMRHVLFVSSCCFLAPILFPGHRLIIFTSFLVFEVCVGIFWPSIAMLRGKYIPEETRSTIMNIFRVPLNLIVIIILLQNMEMKTIFTFCSLFLLLATYLQHTLYKCCNIGSTNGTCSRFSSSSKLTESSLSEDEKPLIFYPSTHDQGSMNNLGSEHEIPVINQQLSPKLVAI